MAARIVRRVWTTSGQHSVLAPPLYGDASTCDRSRPVDDIPGPTALPFLGTSYKQFPFGQYYKKNNVEMMLDKYHKYGPLVRETLLPGFHVIWLFDPDDIAQAYRNECKQPFRPPVECIVAQRKRCGQPVGLTNCQGKEWYRIRKQVQLAMLHPRMVASYATAQDHVCEDFVARLLLLRQKNHVVPNILNELRKWALEAIGIVSFNKRLGALKSEESVSADAQRFVDATMSAMTAMHSLTHSPPFYKYFNTPLFRKFCHHMDVVWELSDEYIREFQEGNCRTDSKDNMLAHLLAQPDLSEDEVVAFIASMLFAGIDTTSHTLAFILYQLATNPEAQRTLQEEVDRVAPSGTAMSSAVLGAMPYMRAVFKETSRLMPTAGTSIRKLQKDLVIRGYHIPAGYHVIFGQPAIGLMPEYFESPDRFLPERWLRNQESSPIHPFAVMPFSHGPRSCVGRRIAKQEIYLMLTKIVRSFRLEYKGEPIQMVTRMLNAPDRPLQCRFVDRQ